MENVRSGRIRIPKHVAEQLHARALRISERAAAMAEHGPTGMQRRVLVQTEDALFKTVFKSIKFVVEALELSAAFDTNLTAEQRDALQTAALYFRRGRHLNGVRLLGPSHLADTFPTFDRTEPPPLITEYSTDPLALIENLIAEIEDAGEMDRDDGVRDGHSRAWHGFFVLKNAKAYLRDCRIDPAVYRHYGPIFTRPGDNYRKAAGV